MKNWWGRTKDAEDAGATIARLTEDRDRLARELRRVRAALAQSERLRLGGCNCVEAHEARCPVVQ